MNVPIVIPVATSAVIEKDVNFYDYDGTLLYSWTLAELTSASSLPTNPSHTGLTAQGWNWTLTELKSCSRQMDVGQMYITDDGFTRLYITIEERKVVPLKWSQSTAYGLSIDWGDDSEAETVDGTGIVNTSHTYTSSGSYVISLEILAGTVILGGASSSTCVMGDIANTTRVYCASLLKVEVGEGFTSLGEYAFTYCYNLKTITLPNNITDISANAFSACYAMSSLIIPINVSSIGSNAFNANYSLSLVSANENLESIGTYSFASNYSLRRFTFPNSTSIGEKMFQYCYGLIKAELPDTAATVSPGIFYYCYSLQSANLPSSATSIPPSFLVYNYCLQNFTIPSSVETIWGASFQYCTALTTLTIPSTVTTIYNSSFYGLYGMKEYHFLPITPPTLGGTSVFYGIPADCIIYVPSASVDDYQAATYWSTYASQIQGE